MKVIVSLPERSNEYQVLQAQDAVAASRRLGLEVETLYAENSAVLQIQQLFQAIRAQPRAIVVEPVSVTGMDSLLRKAAAAGIGIAVLNCFLDEVARLREQYPQVATFTVASDQVEIGRLQGEQMKALLPAGGAVLYLHGPHSASAAQDRFRGLQDALRGSAVKLVSLDALWTEESAEEAVRRSMRINTLESHQIVMVAAQDDSMARGARRAIESSKELGARFKTIPYLGIDGVPDVGQKLVDSGELTATVVMPSNTGAALENIATWLRSGGVPAPWVKMPVRPYPEKTPTPSVPRRA
jgi:ABC-type sugar transport system substrate-binding protein